ncbi:MAG: hypothetical protein ACI4X9_04095 [Kiritimatiellia bacterium]
MIRLRTTILLAALAAAHLLSARVPTSAAGGKPDRDAYVRAWNLDPNDFARDFRGDGELIIEQIATTTPCNMAYPGETPRITLKLTNATTNTLELSATLLLVPYTFTTQGSDIFDLGISAQKAEPLQTVQCSILPKGTHLIERDIPLPRRFGCYALLLQRKNHPTRLFAASFARILEPALPKGRPEYRICMDQDDPLVIERLHTPANRIGVAFIPACDKNSKPYYDALANRLEAIRKTGYPVCVEFGAGPDKGPHLPLGRTRPHLTDDNIMRETKSDFVWLPSYDAEFAQRVKWVVKNFGYPKGPVNALMLWNEPWAGISISGWGADDLRYRELYTTMCQAAEEAMEEEPSVHVLLGGADSSSNTFDKLFGDGKPTFLKWMDFMSLHYQNLTPSNPKFLRDRKHKNGRTRFWDTESWVANSPDRVPAVLAAMLAAGHDRLVGIQGNAVVASKVASLFHAWPCAPALAAFQHFIGNRPFLGVAWAGLPWIYGFGGEHEDLCYVVCGDIAPAIDGRNRLGEAPFWTARNGLSRGTLTLTDGADIEWFDACGNLLATGIPGKPLTITLDDNGTYLRANGKPGSASRLKQALMSARVDGLPAVAPTLRDATRPLAKGTCFRAELRNLLNRPIRGTLQVDAAGLTVDYPRTLSIAAGETRTIPLKVQSGTPRDDNTYPFKLRFTPDDAPEVLLIEKLHCNCISKASPTIDGFLDEDWSKVLPHPIGAGEGGATMMEKAWLPMLDHDKPEATSGTIPKAVVKLAADENCFYFAALVQDETPDDGMKRFETRDEDEDFYPPEVLEYNRARTFASTIAETRAKVKGSRKVWAPIADRLAFTLTPPKGGCCATLLFADDDNMCRRALDISLSTTNGQHLWRHYFRPVSEHARFTFAVKEPLRVEIATRNWLKPHLRAIEFDPPTPLQKPLIETSPSGTFPVTRGTWGVVTPTNPCDGKKFGFEFDETVEKVVHKWPKGVRRFSYRRRPELPCGLGHDNIQIAFNVLSDDAKPWYPAAPGMYKGYSGYWDSDYVFDLNPVAEKYGGGTEVWRERAPGLPDKHFFPHTVKSPLEGPVRSARLCVRRASPSNLVYECAIAWREMPEVDAARRAGKRIKFSCRVNDNQGGRICELAYRRSASKRNLSFKPDWVEHWANEIEFSFQNDSKQKE